MRDITVLLVSHYLNTGGAGRATWNIFKALQAVEEETRVFASLRTVRGGSKSDRVFSGLPEKGPIRRIFFWPKVYLGRALSRKIFQPAEPSLCSLASVQTALGKEISEGSWDVINLHWLGDATLSIEEIGQIDKPIVWSLHDSWPFSGSEHVTTFRRSADGYRKDNRPIGERGPDVNRWTWERKFNSWKRPAGVVAPSAWSAERAEESVLFQGSPLAVIPHPIDIAYWSPGHLNHGSLIENGQFSRPLRLGVGAASGSQSWVKGLDLLPDILGQYLKLTKLGRDDIEIWTFGDKPANIKGFQINHRHFGELGQDELRDLYRNVDIMLVPSFFETFGLVAAEAQSTGTPVISFKRTGVESIVQHLKTGYLADYADVSDFAKGIAWVSSSGARLKRLSQASRESIVRTCQPERVGRLYAASIRQFHEQSNC